jgi:hypothetical protein
MPSTDIDHHHWGVVDHSHEASTGGLSLRCLSEFIQHRRDTNLQCSAHGEVIIATLLCPSNNLSTRSVRIVHATERASTL